MSSEAHITGQPCSKGVEDFRGVHEGKRVFVLASGPSLLDQDLERLKNRLVIGMNRSFLNYPDTHYHCMMDQRLFDLYPEETARARYVFTLKDRPAGIPLQFLGSEGFSEDLTEGIYSGYTVSYFALQLAVYMGFTQVIYLGLDLMHRQGNTHFFGFDFHSRNHETDEFPNMRRMMSAGAAHAAKLGVEVLSCSPHGAPESIDSIGFDEAMAL